MAQSKTVVTVEWHVDDIKEGSSINFRPRTRPSDATEWCGLQMSSARSGVVTHAWTDIDTCLGSVHLRIAPGLRTVKYYVKGSLNEVFRGSYTSMIPIFVDPPPAAGKATDDAVRADQRDGGHGDGEVGAGENRARQGRAGGERGREEEVLVMLVVECRTWAGARKAGREDGEQSATWCRDRVDRLVRLALQSASEVRLCLFGRTMDDATKWALMKEFESTGAETGVPVNVYWAASTVEGKQHPGWPGYIVVMTDDLLPYYTRPWQAEGSSWQESADHMRGHQDHEMGGGYVESMVGLVKRGAFADDISASPPATGRLAPCLCLPHRPRLVFLPPAALFCGSCDV